MEFTAIYIISVYIPPQSMIDLALKELYGTISNQENVHPEATFIMVGVFNQAILTKVLPKYDRHIDISTHLTTATLPFAKLTKPSSICRLANRINGLNGEWTALI